MVTSPPLATTQVWMRVPRTMIPAVTDLAQRCGTTKSAVLRRALALYLAEHTEWDAPGEERLP